MRPGRYSNLILLLGLGWLLTPAAGAAAGSTGERREIDPICALQTDRYRVQLIKEGRCCPNPMELLYEDRRTREQHAIPFEARVGKSATMRLLDDRTLLITGTLEPGAHSLAVVDLEDGALDAEILTFDYRLSPSKRRLVYARYQPPETPDEARFPLLMLYDFGRAAATDALPGRPIFPAANAEQGSEELLEPGHRLLSPMLWSDDETRVVFYEENDREHAVVVLDLPPDDAKQQVRRLPMPLSRLTTSSDASVSPVVTLAWKGPRTVALQAVVGSDVRDAVDVNLPD